MLEMWDCHAFWTKQQAKDDNIFYVSFWDI